MHHCHREAARLQSKPKNKTRNRILRSEDNKAAGWSQTDGVDEENDRRGRRSKPEGESGQARGI